MVTLRVTVYGCFHLWGAGDLKKVFKDFASFGSRQVFEDMDGSKFFKLCKVRGQRAVLSATPWGHVIQIVYFGIEAMVSFGNDIVKCNECQLPWDAEDDVLATAL